MRARQARRRARSSVTVAAVVMGVVGLLAGCSGGADSGDSDAGGAAESVEAGGGAEAALADREVTGPQADAARDSVGSANRPAVTGRAVIRRGEIAIVTKEMNRARLDIEDLLGAHGGYIASEDTSNDRRGRPERSVLVLRIPEPSFDEVMRELAEVGRTKQAERSSEDVTTKLVDVESRVATQEASLARLRDFLQQATDVDDMIRLESEIAERQADLESLKAQQKYLRDHTAMSTVTVRLRTPDAPPPPAEPREAGFLVGLDGGWTALWAVLVGLATVAGAVLPFAVTIAVFAVPVWLLVRAARRRHAAPAVEQADAG